jgi:hypothetical protein
MAITRRNYGRGHSYKIDGQSVDGVTTLIKGGLPKPALMYWSARTVAEYVADNLDQVTGMAGMGRNSIVAALKEVPWTARDQAAAKGTEIHGLAEKLLHDQEVDVPEPVAGFVESCVAFLDQYEVKPIAIEAVIGSRRWRYAGTADALVDMRLPDGKQVRAVMDYKTGASGIWPDVALQLAAYRNGDVYLDADGREQDLTALGLDETAYAVWLRADGYDVYPVNAGPDVFNVFNHLSYVARRCDDKKGVIKSWLGEALQPALIGETP